MSMKTPALPAVVPARFPVASVERLEDRRLMAATTVTITPNRAQTMEGFGTSLGGQTSFSLVRTPEFQKAYYRDLGASVFRIALNPWTLKGTTKNGKPSIGARVEMGPHVDVNADKFDFSEYNIVKYGQMARAAQRFGSEVRVIASVWSPPFWMKGEEINPSTGKPNGTMPTYDDKSGNTAGGTLIDTPANLDQFGRYVAAYVYGFQRAFGVPLYAVSIQNELAFHEPYSSAVYDPKLYVKTVKVVNQWFERYGLTTKIIGPEDVGVGSTDDTGILNRQMAYVDALRADPEALAAVDAYAIHGYANDGITPQRSPEMWYRYWNGQDGEHSYDTYAGIKSDRKESWMTESSGYKNNWANALVFAGAIQDSVVQGNASAYVYWGATNSSKSSFEALAYNDDYSSPLYVAMKHFAKYVRPGSVRLQTDGGSPTGVYTSAFTDPETNTLTTVLINESTEASDVTLKLDGISMSRFGTAVASVEGKTWRVIDSMRVRGGKVTFTMPAGSMFTLVGDTGGAAVIAPEGSIRGVYFVDSNKNGTQDKNESALAGARLFLDYDADGVLDRKEPNVLTAADGTYRFGGLGKGLYRVRRLATRELVQTTPFGVTRIKTGAMTPAGVNMGVARVKFAANSSSIAGHAFNDTDGNGKQDGTEPNAGAKTVYIDANNNGLLDGNETSVQTNRAGNFGFTGLAGGTYRVRRVFSAGFHASTPAIIVTLGEGEAKDGYEIGGTNA